MAKEKPKKQEETATLMISIDQYKKTSDKVLEALMSLQKGLRNCQTSLDEWVGAYRNHRNSLLAGGTGALDSLTIEAIGDPVDPKKKRKREKKERDPNAPKRPLTAAFLYSQKARQIVKADLEKALEPGEKLEPNAVNQEINRRWNAMNEEEKELWKQSYRDSMEVYKSAMKEYTAAHGDVDMAIHPLEDEVSDEAEAAALDSDAEASDAEDSEAASPAKSPTPAPKAPTPPVTKTPRPSKRQKTAKTNGVVASAPHSTVAPSPVPVPTQIAIKPTVVPPPGIEPPVLKEKEKKKSKKVKENTPEEKKKKNKGGEEHEGTPAASVAPAEKKKRDRKRKSEVISA